MHRREELTSVETRQNKDSNKSEKDGLQDDNKTRHDLVWRF